MKLEKHCKNRMVGINERGKRVGEDHPRAKLTQTQVDEMLELREALHPDGSHCWSYGALAKRYGVHKATIRDICVGRHWDRATEWRPA